MLSAPAKLLKAELKLIKPLLANLGYETVRLGQDSIGVLGSRIYGRGHSFTEIPFENFKATLISDSDDGDEGLLYLHGGAYVAGGIEYALGYGAVLASNTSLPVLCAAYRLAPENRFPCALYDAADAFRWMCAKYKKVVVIGESAGGGLLLALTQYLIDNDERLPDALVAISPWTDLTMSSDSYSVNRRNDPTLSKKSLTRWAKAYAGDDLRNPYVSPCFSNTVGYPPTLLTVGSDELLLGDAILMRERFRASGVPCSLIIGDGLWHAYPLFTMPESRKANEQIDAFIKDIFDGSFRKMV